MTQTKLTQKHKLKVIGNSYGFVVKKSEIDEAQLEIGKEYNIYVELIDSDAKASE